MWCSCKVVVFFIIKSNVLDVLVVWRFEVGVTWTLILDGKANVYSYGFVSLGIVASGLEKLLFAGYKTDVTHRRALSTGPKGVLVRESWLYCIYIVFGFVGIYLWVLLLFSWFKNLVAFVFCTRKICPVFRQILKKWRGRRWRCTCINSSLKIYLSKYKTKITGES